MGLNMKMGLRGFVTAKFAKYANAAGIATQKGAKFIYIRVCTRKPA